jgi:exosortase A-associated hydrolase 2
MGHGLFFESQGDALYGFLHPAEGGPKRTCVVFVHGAFEERQDAHLVTKNVANSLAARGFNALRFDLYGHGDSAGEFSDATLARWTADTIAAAKWLMHETGCDRVALVGIRLGATVAARAASALTAAGTPPERLILWQPVVVGQTYATELLRSCLASEMVTQVRARGTREQLIARLRAGECINVGGFALSPGLYDDIIGATLATDLAACGDRTLVVDVVRTREARGSAEVDALANSLAGRVMIERVVELQPVHQEGKYFVDRAEQLESATTRFMDGAV